MYDAREEKLTEVQGGGGREGWTLTSETVKSICDNDEFPDWLEFREFRERDLGDRRGARRDLAPRNVAGALDPRARDSPCSPQDIRLLHELVEDLTKEQDEKTKPRAEQVRLENFGKTSRN